MLRSHRIRLDPTLAQAIYFAKGCGVARFSYNWALARWQQQYEAHLRDPSLPLPNEAALRRELNALKRTEFPWMMEVTKCAPQEAIRALGVAYKNWFQSLSGKRKGPKLKAPTFKRKGQRDSFQIHGNVIAVDGCRIRIPLLGWVRMREPLRFNGAIKTATVSRQAHTWHITLTVETDDLPARSESQAAVGVDVEDLNVKGMMSNHRLARHLADASFGEFKRQLLYKGAQRGVQAVEVGRWYPSSKTSSACGHLYRELKLSERSWTCEGCGAAHDRDKNAARNILAESIRSNTPGAGGRVCGA